MTLSSFAIGALLLVIGGALLVIGAAVDHAGIALAGAVLVLGVFALREKWAWAGALCQGVMVLVALFLITAAAAVIEKLV